MKVAFVHDYLNQYGGAERVLKALITLYPKAPVYTLFHNPSTIRSLFSDRTVRTSFLQQLPFIQKHYKWYLPIMPLAVEHLNVGGHDVVISSVSAFAKGILTKPTSLHIAYCHTPTRYLWSDTVQYLEELPTQRVIKCVLPLILNQLRLWDWQAAQRVDRFIANSQFVARRIQKYYQRSSTIIYPPVDVDHYTLAPKDEIGNYYLLISRLRPYKKVDMAIEAFNRMRIPLKIIGVGEEHGRLRKHAGATIEFLGLVDDHTKAALLARARALIHPQEEDFGITAVEAMASGRPVIAYKAGGALETVIEGVTGTFFDEQSWEALADAVIRFEHHAFNPQHIRASALRFDRSRFLEEMKVVVEETYKEFLEGRGRVV